MVPERDVGRIVGKSGVTIMKIEKDTGTKLQLGDIKVRVASSHYG